MKDLVDNVEVDTIHHEHLCYYSLTSLMALLARRGTVHDVERSTVDGGSLRLYVGKTGLSSWRVRKLLDEERTAWGVDRAAFYASLGQRVERLRHDLVALLRSLKADGHRIAGYGASAEGARS